MSAATTRIARPIGTFVSQTAESVREVLSGVRYNHFRAEPIPEWLRKADQSESIAAAKAVAREALDAACPVVTLDDAGLSALEDRLRNNPLDFWLDTRGFETRPLARGAKEKMAEMPVVAFRTILLLDGAVRSMRISGTRPSQKEFESVIRAEERERASSSGEMEALVKTATQRIIKGGLETTVKELFKDVSQMRQKVPDQLIRSIADTRAHLGIRGAIDEKIRDEHYLFRPDPEEAALYLKDSLGARSLGELLASIIKRPAAFDSNDPELNDLMGRITKSVTDLYEYKSREAYHRQGWLYSSLDYDIKTSHALETENAQRAFNKEVTVFVDLIFDAAKIFGMIID